MIDVIVGVVMCAIWFYIGYAYGYHMAEKRWCVTGCIKRKRPGCPATEVTEERK